MNFWRKGVGLEYMLFIARSLELQALPYALNRPPRAAASFNRVGGGISPPASHTTGHAGPRPAVPGSPNGLSSHSFSATVIAAQCSANRLHRPGNKTTAARVLPAKFSPSRVVRPSGVIPGSLPVSYTHLRAHETRHDLVCRLLLEKK